VFAQYGAWRAAFWSLLALTPFLLLLVETNLPRGMNGTAGPARPVARLGLAVLAASALAVSAGSMASDPLLNALGLAVALGLLVLFRRLESAGGARVLPLGACDPQTKLGAVYLAMLLLLLGVNSEIFVPYFLQALHGMSPLYAGYLSAMMSGGWSVGSITSSASRRVGLALRVGPLAMACGLVTLFALMPRAGLDAPLAIGAIGVALGAIGLGIGICWPHLGTGVFTHAPEADRDLASASITTVIMVGNAFGSALGGMITNMADMDHHPSQAASWLFALFTIAPLGAILATRRLR
jgi:predicted MFS family arabinose efflux permease